MINDRMSRYQQLLILEGFLGFGTAQSLATVFARVFAGYPLEFTQIHSCVSVCSIAVQEARETAFPQPSCQWLGCRDYPAIRLHIREISGIYQLGNIFV